jgi:hypothetical protein
MTDLRKLGLEELQAAHNEFRRRVAQWEELGLSHEAALCNVVSNRVRPIVPGETCEQTAARFGIIQVRPPEHDRFLRLEEAAGRLSTQVEVLWSIVRRGLDEETRERIEAECFHYVCGLERGDYDAALAKWRSVPGGT